MTNKIDIPAGMLTVISTPSPDKDALYQTFEDSNADTTYPDTNPPLNIEPNPNVETFEMFDDRIEGGTVDPDLEGIDVDNIDMAQPGVLEALVEEIKDRAKLAVQYKTERDEAKTRTKRDIYDKKLTKNNMIAADLIVALEQIVDERAKRESANNEMIETNDGDFICADQIEFTEE